MKESIIQKLHQLQDRFDELNRLLAAEETAKDMSAFRSLSKEHADLEAIVSCWLDYQQTKQAIRDAEDMLLDPELHDLAQDDLSVQKSRLEQLEQALYIHLLPKDPDDQCNLFLEIRAGTGGDEAALFAGDLLRMYTRYAERRGWRTEFISASESALGGFKEVIIRIEGLAAYATLKFESGGHRVQRVPVTETQGRVHTSACTVAIMPEVDELETVQINPSDLRIDTFRASGAGGQHVNKTDSAVRVTHLPTGLVVECQDDRSQHKNRAKAMAVLAARLMDQQRQARQQEESLTRKSLIGSGDRSERIRTYNFPQGRMTDHRINLTLYRLDSIMDGDLNELSDALIREHQAELLTQLGV